MDAQPSQQQQQMQKMQQQQKWQVVAVTVLNERTARANPQASMGPEPWNLSQKPPTRPS
jgi:hypothetical protein